MIVCTWFCYRMSEFLYAFVLFESRIHLVKIIAKIGVQENLNFDCKSLMHVDPSPQSQFPKQAMVEVNSSMVPNRVQAHLSSSNCNPIPLMLEEVDRWLYNGAATGAWEGPSKSFTLPIQSFILLFSSLPHCLSNTGTLAKCMEFFLRWVEFRYIVHRFDNKQIQFNTFPESFNSQTRHGFTVEIWVSDCYSWN